MTAASKDWSLSFWCAKTDIDAWVAGTGAGSGVLITAPPDHDDTLAGASSDELIAMQDHALVTEDVSHAYVYPYAFDGKPVSPKHVTGNFVNFFVGGNDRPMSVSHVDQEWSGTLINMAAPNSSGDIVTTPLTNYLYNNPGDAKEFADIATGPKISTNVLPSGGSITNTSVLSSYFVKGNTTLDPSDPAFLWSGLGGFPSTTWVHVMISMSGGQRLVIYMNDTSIVDETVSQQDDVTVAGGTSSITLPDEWTFPFDRTDFVDVDSAQQVWAFCGRPPQGSGGSTLPDGSGPDPSVNGLIINLVEAWFAAGQFVDWAIEANRYKFHIANAGKTIFAPCSVGATGSLPTGSVPTLYLSGGPAVFPVNKATSLSLSVFGAVQASSVPVPT